MCENPDERDTYWHEFGEIGQFLFPEVAACEELASKNDDDERNNEESEQAEAANLWLSGGVRLLWPYLLAALDLFVPLLFTSRPRLMLLLSLFTVLRVSKVKDTSARGHDKRSSSRVGRTQGKDGWPPLLTPHGLHQRDLGPWGDYP